MIEAIVLELSYQKNYISEEINTIYFGGGTPSLLNASSIDHLINQINKTFTVDINAEITLEANPEDINEGKVNDYKKLGINRISLGVQSFDDTVLKKLNRQHSGKQAINAIDLLKNGGINNLSIDLIYGIPGQDHERWHANLVQAVELGIPHLSSYALTIEEKTVFGNWQKSGKFDLIDEKSYADDYKVLCDVLATQDYSHYEISNFAKAGFESKHNTSYWNQEPYLGLGPGAHSYNGQNRQFNVSNNAAYIRALKNRELPFEEDVLTKGQEFNEYLLTGLRTNRGINFPDFEKRFSVNLYEKHRQFVNKCIDDNMATLANGQFILTEAALILADSVIIEMMIDE